MSILHGMFEPLNRLLRETLFLGGRVIPGTMVRPFMASDLRPCPAGWSITGPQFVGIGTPKAGTSWWYSLLHKHPQIVPNRMNKKELAYFHHFGIDGINQNDLETYRQAFAVPRGSVTGEWSPGYLCQPYCLMYLSMLAPQPKIIVLLRNPVDRLISHFNQLVSTRLTFFPKLKKQRYLIRTFSLLPEAVACSYCSNELKLLFKYFDRSRLLFLQYEKCKIDPIAEIKRTYSFLEVDDTFVPSNIRSPVNVKEYEINEVQDDRRRQMADWFADDVREQFELLPSLDKSLWPDFNAVR